MLYPKNIVLTSSNTASQYLKVSTMLELASIYRYPLTGARAETLEDASVDHNGITGDRHYLLFIPQAGKAALRLSQKQYPKLAQLSARYAPPIEGRAALEVEFPSGEHVKLPYSDATDEDWSVDEFGVRTPVNESSPWQSKLFADFLGDDRVTLGRKTLSWLLDAEGRYIRPEQRAVAPLHIVSAASVRKLQSRANSTDFGAERFRPSIVIDGDVEPFSENSWVGMTLYAGSVAIRIHRSTKRCPVPGFDQLTGINKKDILKNYIGSSINPRTINRCSASTAILSSNRTIMV